MIVYVPGFLAVRVSMTIVLGVVGGICWVTFWWFASVPVLSVLLVSLDLGFMIACIVFYTPFGKSTQLKHFFTALKIFLTNKRIFCFPGDLEILKNDINYWSTFACFMLLPGLFLLCTMHLVRTISSFSFSYEIVDNSS